MDLLYGGDVEACLRKGPKAHSFRRLADRLKGLLPPCLCTAASLNRAVRAYRMVRDCGLLEEVARWQHLQIAHLRALSTGLLARDQKRLLARAEEEGWTEERLTLEAKERRSLPTKGGRPALPTWYRSVRALRRPAENPGLLLEGLDQSTNGAVDRAAALRIARQLRDGLGVLIERLESGAPSE